MAHAHAGRGRRRPNRAAQLAVNGLTHRTLLIVVIAVGAVAAVAMIVMWPGERVLPEGNPAQRTTTSNATLIDVAPVEGAHNPSLSPNAVTVNVTARVDGTGDVVEFE